MWPWLTSSAGTLKWCKALLIERPHMSTSHSRKGRAYATASSHRAQGLPGRARAGNCGVVELSVHPHPEPCGT
eukprot:9952301-Alexandrium_andersonii.AAC.1